MTINKKAPNKLGLVITQSLYKERKEREIFVIAAKKVIQAQCTNST